MENLVTVAIGVGGFVSGAWLIAKETVAQRRKAARKRALLIRLYLECAR